MTNTLQSIGWGVVIIGGTVTLSLTSYLIARFFLAKHETDHHKEVANSVVVRLAALHGLILALVFAQEMDAYKQLENVLSAEANALGDVYNDAIRYGDAEAEPIKSAVLHYMVVVTTQEWPTDGPGGRLAAEGWDAWDAAYQRVLDLTPGNDRQELLRDHMLERVHAISESRDKRDQEWSVSTMEIFWFPAIAGVILIAAGYYVFPPERQVILMLTGFGTYTGIVIFMIFAFSSPFAAPAAMRPEPITALLQDLGQKPP